MMDISEEYPVDLKDESNREALYDRGCEYLKAPKILGKNSFQEAYAPLFKKFELFFNEHKQKWEEAAIVLLFSYEFGAKNLFQTCVRCMN
jgi:hypothetical protein